MGLKLRKNKTPKRQPSLNNSSRPSFSYYSAENQASKTGQGTRRRSETLAIRDYRQFVRRVPTIVSMAVIFIAVVFSTTLTITPQVRFANEQSPYRDITDYQMMLRELMSSSLLNRSKLTINATKFENNILATFPEIDAARIVLPIIGRRPSITLHIRRPALLLTTKTNALILDNTGKAVSEVNQLPSSVVSGLLSLQDDSGLEVYLGDQAVTTETVAFIDNVRKQLEDKKMIIEKLVLPAVVNELDIYIRDLPYRLKADVSGNARSQIGAFLAAKDNGIKPSEYIDVRVEEKVFYK